MQDQMSCTCSTWNRFIDIGEVLTGRGASFSSCLYDPRLRRTEAHLGLTNVHRTINYSHLSTADALGMHVRFSLLLLQ